MAIEKEISAVMSQVASSTDGVWSYFLPTETSICMFAKRSSQYVPYLPHIDMDITADKHYVYIAIHDIDVNQIKPIIDNLCDKRRVRKVPGNNGYCFYTADIDDQ